jgi:hypothetical protein
MKKTDNDDYQVSVSLQEWRLIQRLRQSRRDNRVLLIQTADCREVGNLPAGERTRFNSREKG